MCKFGLWFFANIVFFRLAQKYLVPRKHATLTQSVLRTKLSKNDCHGTWFQSWQCYQRPPAQQWFNGWTSVHPCLCTLEGREPHLSLTELPRQHAMLTQDVLRTKLSRNDCYGTWSPSRQCYQGPQTERKLKGVHLCAPLSGPKQFCKSTMEAVKMPLNPIDFDV